jgi:hypothetical protein
MQASAIKRDNKESRVEPGSWSWLKQWSGYVVTVLPYVSAGLVLIPGISVWIKAAILFVFAVIVTAVRIVHEKAGIEVTGEPQRKKTPHAEQG